MHDPSQPVVQAVDLCKSYQDLQRGEFKAVDCVSFSAYSGRIFGLLGPNGAGKTTTLRMLSTMLEPTGGTAVLAGFDVVRQPHEVRKRIGFISASTGVYDRMTAWEMVEYFGRLNGMPDDLLHDRMERLFERLKMEELRDRMGSKMSTGMKQKVSIARALIHDPPVLIFDEPTSGLDVMAARSLLEAVRELREQGKCILYSTHIMSEVEKLCDQVAVLNHGRILDFGTFDELRDRHSQNDFEELFYQLVSNGPERVETTP